MQDLIEMTGQSEMTFGPSAAEVSLQESTVPLTKIAKKKPGLGWFADSGQDIRYTVVVAVERRSFAVSPEQDSQ